MKKLNGVYRENLHDHEIDYISGKATFFNRSKVVVEQNDEVVREITAENILTAVGSHPRVSKIPVAEFGITSDGFFNLLEQPKKVAVIGEGYIAIGLAGTLHTLGTETHMFIRNKGVLQTFDPIIQETLLAEYERQGIYVHDHSNVSKIEDIGNDWERVHYKRNGIREVLDVDCLL